MSKAIVRVGFKSAGFVFNSMESSMASDKGAAFEETDRGIIISDIHPERARKRSLFPSVLIPWGNVAYVAYAKEEVVVGVATAKRGRKTTAEAEESV